MYVRILLNELAYSANACIGAHAMDEDWPLGKYICDDNMMVNLNSTRTHFILDLKNVRKLVFRRFHIQQYKIQFFFSLNLMCVGELSASNISTEKKENLLHSK